MVALWTRPRLRTPRVCHGERARPRALREARVRSRRERCSASALMTTRPLSQLAISAARWPPVAALVTLLGCAAVLPERYGLLPVWASRPLWGLVLGLIALST